MCTDRNREINKRYEESGLSQRAFAYQEGISTSTLNYHLKQAKTQAKEGFTQIEVCAPQEFIVITTPSGTTIEIPL